jgi:hypothetical protein
MKKVLLLLCAAAVIAAISCKSDKNKADDPENEVIAEAPANLQTQEYIEGRMAEIYGFVLGESKYTEADEKFFTKDFFALQEKVLKKQNESGNLYIDHDHWIMGQDCHNPSYEFVKAEEINGQTAKAYVKVKAFDEQEKPELVRFTLRFNGDEWMVDDIEEEYEGVFYSHRKMYEEALAE